MGTRIELDDLRLLAALGVLLVLGFVFVPRAADAQPSSDPVQRENALAAKPAGTAWPASADDGNVSIGGAATSATAIPQPTPPPSPAPTPAPTAAPTATPAPTPAVAADGFAAQVLA